LRVRSVQLRFGCAHVGALIDQLRRQAHRQILRQLQRTDLEGCSDILVGQVPGQRAQQIARLIELVLERRQQLLGQRERARPASELFGQHHRIVCTLAQLPDGSPERIVALTNLRNIRRVLARREFAPG
jgi:hypothetical protein